MKNKLLRVLLVVFLICACLVPVTACSNSSKKLEPIEITEKTYRDYVYLNKEYDVMNIVENVDEDLSYGITELFYLDSKLDRVDMEYSGTKFTQTAPYDVYVTLQASKGKSKVEVEFVIEFATESNSTSDNFISAWADEGVTRMLTANENYLFNGANFAIKVSYVGERQTVGNAAEIGGIYEADSDMSYTSWENAVLTADVYNPNDYDLELGIVFKKANAVWTNNASFAEKYYMLPQRLKAKECTTVAWSFKALNILSDIFSEQVNLSIKCRIHDDFAANATAPYSYSFFINNLDITDYSETKFPNLNTTFDAPIVMNNGASASYNNSYADGVVTRDTTTEADYLYNGSSFAFKVNVNRPEAKAKDLIGIVGSADNCSKTSWDNVVLTADVYNSTDRDLEMGILFVKNNQAWLNDGKIENVDFIEPITLSKNAWTTVAWSMKSFGVVSNVFSDKVTIYTQTRIKDTTGLSAPFVYSLAITNLDFVDYSATKFPNLDTNEPFIAVMNNKASESFRDSSADSVVTRALTNETDYLHNGSSFAFKANINSSKTNPNIIGLIESADNCSKTNWNNVVLTADVYNPQNYDLEMGLLFATKSNEVWLNDGIIEDKSFLKPITLTKNGWTTVSWSMKAFGVGSDIFADDIVIQIKTKIKDASGLTAPYVYNVGVTNLDFVDYDVEKFPTLSLYYGTYRDNETTAINQNIPFTAGNLDTISFDYCIENIVSTGGAAEVYLRIDGNETPKLGSFKFNADGEVEDYAGVTVTSLGNGYNRVVIKVDEVTLKDGDPALTALNQIAFPRWKGATYYYGNLKVTYKSAT